MRKIYCSGSLIITFWFACMRLWSQTPTIGNPGPNATIDCTATPFFTAPTASAGCGGIVVNVVSDVTTGTSCAKTFIRSWDASDACGNHSATVSQSITVMDLPPTIGAPGGNATIECSATPLFTTPTASDACGPVTVNLLSSVTTGNSCVRTLTRTYDAVDVCGNHSATVSQSITVVDRTPPIIAVFGSTTTLGINPSATQIDSALGHATVADLCSLPSVTFADGPIITNKFHRSQTRTFTVTDACGNMATASRTVTWGVSVFGTVLVPTDYLTLAAFIQDADSLGMSGPTTVELQPGYSSFIPVVIGQIPGSNSTNTLTIRPAADATGLVIGSPKPIFDPNSLTFFLPPPTLVTVDLQNANNVIIDGRPGGVGTQSQLTIQNFSIAGNAVRFVYGANNNVVKYCTLEGINATSQYTSSPAVVMFDSTGNKPNTKDTILNCIIRGIGDITPVYNAIYSSGINDLNGNNFISNNQIADFTNAGILVSPMGNGGNWTITGNSFYYDLSAPATTDQTAIQFVPGASAENNIVSNNFIGGSTANAGGVAWVNSAASGSASFTGINVEGGTTTGTAVHGNVIQNLLFFRPQTAVFTGLVFGMLAANDSNIVGSPITANSIQVSANSASATGIFINSSYPVSITNDKICNISVTGGTTVLIACRKSGRGSEEVGKLNIFNLSATGGTVTGILDEGTGDATISGNSIKNISGSTASDIKITKPTDASTAKLLGNVLSGNASSIGISADVQNLASLTLVVEDNTITGFSKGIVLTKSSGATLNTSIFDNAITGNSVGVDNETATATNATCNWWGSANGPAAGQITGNVIYSPWATIPQYVSVNAGADQTIYIGYGPQSATLTASSIACGTPQYLWSTGATSQSITVSPTTTTNYLVSLTDAAGHKALDTVTVFVVNIVCGNNNDKVLMCHKGGTICIKKADVADHLKQGDQLGPCPTVSITQSRVMSEGNIFERDLSVYPNPANDKLKLEWFAAVPGLQRVEVFDLLGRKVIEQKIMQLTGLNSRQLDLGNLEDGTYMLKMTAGKVVNTTKFIIRRQ